MKMNKGILLIICLCLLTACRSSSPRIIRSDESKNEKIEIHFLTNTNGGKEIPIFNTLIEEIENDHANLKILFEGYESSSNGKTFSDMIDQRVKNGKANDIVTMDVANIFDYANQGKLLDLSDSEIGQSLNAYAQRDSLVNGKIMSLPLSMTSYCLWINMDVLNKCQLAIPTNWNEFLNCCKVLKESGYQPIVGTKNFPKMFILACLGDIYLSEEQETIIEKLNSGEVNISQYAKTGMEHLVTLIENGYIDSQKALQYKPKDTKELFTSQQGIFAIGTSAEYNPDEFNFEIGLMGIPGSDETIALLASDRRIVVMNDSEHKEESVTFLSYLKNEKVQKTVTSSFGSLSAYTDSHNFTDADARLQPLFENIKANRIMLIQDYHLKFEQWKNLNDMVNELLEGKSIESQLDVFDSIQMEAITERN